MFKVFKRYRTWRRERTPRQLTRNQRKVVLALQMLALALVAIVVLLGVGRTIFNVIRPVPNDVQGVLESTENPARYHYETQIKRVYSYDGDTLERHRVHSFAINTEVKAFQGSVFGVTGQPILLAGDANRTIRYIEGEDESYQEIEKLGIDKISPPPAAELLEMKPTLITDRETVNSVRAWVVGFQPTPAMLKRLLLADALDLGEFDTTKEDIAQIEKGDYTVEWAHAYIARTDRQLLRMDVMFQLGDKNGPRYRTLTTWADFGADDLDDFEIRPGGEPE